MIDRDRQPEHQARPETVSVEPDRLRDDLAGGAFRGRQRRRQPSSFASTVSAAAAGVQQSMDRVSVDRVCPAWRCLAERRARAVRRDELRSESIAARPRASVVVDLTADFIDSTVVGVLLDEKLAEGAAWTTGSY